MPRSLAYCMAVDLGETTTCAAVMVQDRGLEVTATMPSCVAGHLVGKDAEGQLDAVMNHTRGAYDGDRNDPNHIILKNIKRMSEEYLGEKVTHAVMTVPAYFDATQRQATKAAGESAGLDVIRVINEPSSACLAYDVNNSNDEKTMLVLDMNRRTVAVTLVTSEEGILEVIATAYRPFGGADFTNSLVRHVTAGLTKQHGIDITADPVRMKTVTSACEDAKCRLSFESSVGIVLSSFCDGVDFHTSVTREAFEDCLDNEGLLDGLLPCVREALSTAGIDRRSVEEILFSGGSTRIPKVRDIIEQYFQMDVNMTIDPVEVVARGAARQAALLWTPVQEPARQCVLLESTKLSLGVETDGGIVTPILPMDTVFPCINRKLLAMHGDSKGCLSINVFVGQRALAKDCILKGTLHLVGVPPAPSPTLVEVTCYICLNCTLHVVVVDKSERSGRGTAELRAESYLPPSFNHDTHSMLLKEAEEYAEADRLEREKHPNPEVYPVTPYTGELDEVD